jgi:ribosome-associated protein
MGVGDLVLAPGPGIPSGLVIAATELEERFSRSSGPGGQSVNTADSRVELRFDLVRSVSLTPEQRQRALERLNGRLVDGVLALTSSVHRSQLRNRAEARERLAGLLREALAPPLPPRRATRPSAAARRRRVEAKIHRSGIKANRRNPPPE